MRHLTIFLACLLLPACGLFSADTAPAIAALTEMERITARVQARADAIVAKITDPAAQATLSAGFLADFEAIERLRQAVMDWTASVGEIDWEDLYRKVKDVTRE